MSAASVHLQTAVDTSNLIAAEASYLENLRLLAAWVQTDQSRTAHSMPDTSDHIKEGLRILELVSNSAGETVCVHDQAFASPQCQMTPELKQLQARRNRFAGTATHLSQMFDQLVLRLSGSSSTVLH